MKTSNAFETIKWGGVNIQSIFSAIIFSAIIILDIILYNIQMCDFDNLNKLTPCLIEDTQCIRKMHSYTVKKRQFLESTGIHVISEVGGFLIKRVIVSGLTHSKDITQHMIQLFKQVDCPLAEITIDTGHINKYTGHDIECGTRKIIQFDYMFDDSVSEEKKLRRIEIDDKYMERQFDPTECCDSYPCDKEDFKVTGSSDVYIINKDKCG